MRKGINVFIAMMVLLAVPLMVFAGGEQEETAQTIRIMSAVESAEQIAIYDRIIEEFKADHPGIDVKWDRSAGGDYEFQGLPSALQGTNPPDIFFEWGGNRVRNHVVDGEIDDLSHLKTRLADVIGASAWSGCELNDKTYMLPTTQEVTVMMWYNVDIFNKLGLSVPETWEDFLNVCETISRAGITPILLGNSDAWPAGNFISLFFSRVAGDEYTDNVLSLKSGTKFNNPDFVKALQYAYDLGSSGYINDDLNTLDYDISFSRLFDNSSAMYPLGTWFWSRVIPDSAPDPEKANFDFFIVPAFEDGKGNQTSYMGVNTGFVLNADSANKELSEELLLRMEEVKYRLDFAQIGDFPAVGGTLDLSDPYIKKVSDMMSNTDTVVSPPDTGYNLEMAAALYQAIAKVLVNAQTPEEALSEVDSKVAHLR